MYVSLAGRTLIGVVFLIAATSKLRGRSALVSFVESLRVWRLIPAVALWPTAVALVSAELAIPALLAHPVTSRIGLGVAVILLGMLSVGVTAALVRGVSTSCRCFGASADPLRPRHLVRNVVLLTVAIVTLAATGTGTGHPAGTAVALAVGLVLGVTATRLDDLVDLFTPAAPTLPGERRLQR